MESDWLKESDYTYIYDLNDHQIAFEFLRRNPKYQARYQEFTDEVKYLMQKSELTESSVNQARSIKDFWKCDPEIKDGETLLDWDRRVMSGNLPFERIPLDLWHGRRWGIRNAFPDPSGQAASKIRFTPPKPFPLMPFFEDVKGYFEDDEPFPQKPDTAVLTFDLLSPVSQQINEARMILSSRQEQLEVEGLGVQTLGFNTPTTNKDEVIKLLRALDGDAADGVEIIEIGNELLPHKPQSIETSYNRSKTASNLIKSAKSISERRYRLIPFS